MIVLPRRPAGHLNLFGGRNATKLSAHISFGKGGLVHQALFAGGEPAADLTTDPQTSLQNGAFATITLVAIANF